MFQSLRTVPAELKTLGFDPAWPGELRALKTLEGAGLPIAPTVVIPQSIEEEFLRLNNLGSQLTFLLKTVDLNNLDEDHLEDIAIEAQVLIDSHYLLDEVIDEIYFSWELLGDRIRVRLPDQNGRVEVRGRPALIAMKALWREPWSAERITQRLSRKGSSSSLVGPIFSQFPDQIPTPPQLVDEVRAILGPNVKVVSSPGVGVSGVFHHVTSRVDS
jgi:hypothetical protein